jgi:hypothetical protein
VIQVREADMGPIGRIETDRDALLMSLDLSADQEELARKDAVRGSCIRFARRRREFRSLKHEDRGRSSYRS